MRRSKGKTPSQPDTLQCRVIWRNRLTLKKPPSHRASSFVGLPFAGQPLRLRDLRWGHLRGDHIPLFGRVC